MESAPAVAPMRRPFSKVPQGQFNAANSGPLPQLSFRGADGPVPTVFSLLHTCSVFYAAPLYGAGAWSRAESLWLGSSWHHPANIGCSCAFVYRFSSPLS